MAFIPARGGSTGVTNKNLQEIHGISLVQRSWLHAFDCGFFDFYILSTDSFEIASRVFGKISKKSFLSLLENEVIEVEKDVFFHKRPLSDAKTLSPIRNTLFQISKLAFADFDLLWMLQPTSPFRNVRESREIRDLGDGNSRWSSIVSMKDTGGVHPDRMYRVNTNFAEPYLSQSGGDNVPRQLLEKLYIKDGAYYVLRKTNLSRGIMLGNEVLPIIRSGKWTINIDTQEDLEMAQKIGEED